MKAYLVKVAQLYAVQWHMRRYRACFVYLLESFLNCCEAWFLLLISPFVFLWAATKCICQPWHDAAKNTSADCQKSLTWWRKKAYDRWLDTPSTWLDRALTKFGIYLGPNEPRP